MNFVALELLKSKLLESSLGTKNLDERDYEKFFLYQKSRAIDSVGSRSRFHFSLYKRSARSGFNRRYWFYPTSYRSIVS